MIHRTLRRRANISDGLTRGLLICPRGHREQGLTSGCHAAQDLGRWPTTTGTSRNLPPQTAPATDARRAAVRVPRVRDAYVLPCGAARSRRRTEAQFLEPWTSASGADVPSGHGFRCARRARCVSGGPSKNGRGLRKATTDVPSTMRGGVMMPTRAARSCRVSPG